MKQNTLRKIASELLKPAGVSFNGDNPWDIQLHDENVLPRVFNGGTVALGESYMDKWWDCKNLDQFFDRAIKADLESKINANKWILLNLLILKFFNFQTKKRALDVGKKHYDLGNDLFKNMLDSRMNYTCGYWKNASCLEDAQHQKLELVCQKLCLKPGMRVLDIGCGFGALAKYAAENFGVSVVGVSISQEQCDYARKNCKNLPVEIRFQDYREVNEKYDRVVSLGMFEHVGHLNYRTYMQQVRQCLHDDGLFLLHTIGGNISTVLSDPWINKYIFPNGMIPSIAQIGKASEGLFVMEDWHNFGADYDKTLMAWHANFNTNWEKLCGQYDERFYRMWNYYLLSCAGTFRARCTQLWQVVFSTHGVLGGYEAPRL